MVSRLNIVLFYSSVHEHILYWLESRRSSCKLRNTLSITAFSAYFKPSCEIKEYVWNISTIKNNFFSFILFFFSIFYICKRRFIHKKQVKNNVDKKERRLGVTFISKHFKLENGVGMAPKRRIFISCSR